MHRPSPALVLSLIALVCSLGGSAYAAGLIDGKALKKRSVAGAKLRKDTLGGKEIKKARLGKVPSPRGRQRRHPRRSRSGVLRSGRRAYGLVQPAGDPRRGTCGWLELMRVVAHHSRP